MEGSPTIGWTIPNLITVTIMVILTFAIVGFLYRIGSAFIAPKVAQGAPMGEVGDLS